MVNSKIVDGGNFLQRQQSLVKVSFDLVYGSYNNVELIMRVLVAESGEYKGTCWELSNVPLTIGRGSGCVILLSDTAVSRMHCTLRIEKDGVHFEDQASRNATLVNGVPKSSGRIDPGDRLTIGESIFTLSMSSEKISRDPGTKGSSSTIHILAENVPYLEASSKSVSEGNPQTVSDLYWLFTSTRRLSASHVREHFIATLVDIMQDRFSADGILIRGLRSPQ